MHTKNKYLKEDASFLKEDVISYNKSQSFEKFYAHVYQYTFQSLFAYGMQICGNRELVKDSIQELFSELWNNKKGFIKVKSVKPYLFKCLKGKIKRELGKKKYLYVEGEFEFEISHESNLIKNQQNTENQHLLEIALKSLTPRQREAIYLRFYDNLSYEEISEILKINTRATYKLVYRDLSVLKKDVFTFSTLFLCFF